MLRYITRLVDWLRQRCSPLAEEMHDEKERLIQERHHCECHHSDGPGPHEDIIDKVRYHRDTIRHLRDSDHVAAQYLFHTEDKHPPSAFGLKEKEEPCQETPSEPAPEESREYWRGTENGASIVEGVAALAVILPLIFTILFAVVEGTQYMMIRSSLTEAVNRAVRHLTVAYWKDPDVAFSRSLQDTMVFDQIRIGQVVKDSRQFADPVFNTGAVPPTVSVTVTYQGGQYGLPPFPNPDPLGIGSGFTISVSATHAIE